jgi:hypothetical protein
MSLPAPLELQADSETNFGFPEDALDLYQIFSICKEKNISLLYPDNANKIFTNLYNNEANPIFENVIGDICKSTNTAVFYITTVDGPIRNSVVKLFLPSSRGLTKKNIQKNTKFSIQTLHQKGIFDVAFILEYSPVPDSAFSHYCVALYDFSLPNIICMFDSMMNVDETDPEPSEYSGIFASLLKNDIIDFDYMNQTDPTVVFDLYRDNPDNSDAYELELTGGSLDVPNKFIENMKTIGNKSRITRYIYCSDNQNQFCYMWVFLYLVLKLYPKYELKNGMPSKNLPDFITFHKRICEKKIIPLTVIKTFIFNTFFLDYIRQIEIIRKYVFDDWFLKYFRTITSMSNQYPDSNTRNTSVKLFEITNLNPQIHIGLSYSTIFELIPNIVLSLDSISLMDITKKELKLSNNEYLFKFVDAQLALAFSRKTSIYKFITDNSNDDPKIDMTAFNKYANQYEDITIDDPQKLINFENFDDYLTN